MNFSDKNYICKKLSNNQCVCWITFLLLLFIVSCVSNEEKAKQRLELARTYNEKNDFNAAKLQIDSIKLLYPKEIAVIKESNKLMWRVEKKEQEHSLKYLDSLLIVNTKKVYGLKEALGFERNTEYQTIGNYLNKNQTVERNIGKTFLRFTVTENGEMNITATIYGHGQGSYNSLKAETNDGTYADSPPLSKDDGNNYTFVDGGVSTQTLNYKRGNDNGFIDFLYTYKEQPLKISFLGGKTPYSYTLSQQEKEALTQIYDLSTALAGITKTNYEIKAAKNRIEFCENTINQLR